MSPACRTPQRPWPGHDRVKEIAMTGRYSWTFAFVCGAALLGFAALRAHADQGGQPAQAKPLVRLLQGIKIEGFEKYTKEIASEKELAQAFGEKDQAKIKEQVDFTKEKVVLVTWAGSSSSGLTFDVQQDKGKIKVIVAIVTPNPALADYRPHGGLIVMPKEATWEFGPGAVSLPKGEDNKAKIGPARAELDVYLTDSRCHTLIV
jgi:hypothetical protein